MTAAKTKEKTLSERIDECCKSFLWSAGIGTSIGGIIGVFILKSRKWPAILGLGTGMGVAWSKCEKSLNTVVTQAGDKELYRCQEEFMARKQMEETKFRATLRQLAEQYAVIAKYVKAKIEEHEGPNKNDWFSLKAGLPKYSKKCVACTQEEENCEKAKPKSKKEGKIQTKSVSNSSHLNLIQNEMQLNNIAILNQEIIDDLTNSPEENSVHNDISADSNEYKSSHNDHSAEIIENYYDTDILMDERTQNENDLETDSENMNEKDTNSKSDIIWTLMRILRGENYIRRQTEHAEQKNNE